MGGEKTHKYDLFISHSSRLDPDDLELVDKLVKALERRGLTVFLDRNCLKNGQQVLPALHEAVCSSDVGVIMLTRKAIDSGWVEYEYDLLRSQAASGRMRILGLLLDPNCQIPARLRTQDVIEIPRRFDVSDIADRVVAAIRAFLTLRKNKLP